MLMRIQNVKETMILWMCVRLDIRCVCVHTCMCVCLCMHVHACCAYHSSVVCVLCHAQCMCVSVCVHTLHGYQSDGTLL